MYQTLKQMRDRIGRQLQDVTSVRDIKVDEWINAEYQSIAERALWPELVKLNESLSWSAGTKIVYLPKAIDELFFVYVVNDPGLLQVETLSKLIHMANATKDTSGSTERWAYVGESSIKAAIATAEQVNVTSAVGTDECTVVIHGTVSGDEVVESVTVSSGSGTSTTTWTDIYSISADGDHTGVLTIAGATSSTTYCTIGVRERTSKYKQLRLYYLPATADTVCIAYKKKVIPLELDDQIPEIPLSEAIVAKVLSVQYSQLDKMGQSEFWDRRAERVLDDKFFKSVAQGTQGLQGVSLARGGVTGRVLVVAR